MLANSKKLTQIQQTITDVAPFLFSKIIQNHINQNIIIIDTNQKIGRYFGLMNFIIQKETHEVILFDSQNVKSIFDIYFNNKRKIILSNDEIFHFTIPQINDITKYITIIKIGKSINTYFPDLLSKYGYLRTETVRVYGEFAVRGEIVDIGISQENGIRIHLFDDVIESISQFNFINQISEKSINQYNILPINFESLIFKDLPKNTLINVLQTTTIIIDYNTLEENFHNINNTNVINHVYEISPFVE